jgi:hypothetical protein
VKFGHALVILGKPIVSRINEDHLGKNSTFHKIGLSVDPIFFLIVRPIGLLELAV